MKEKVKQSNPEWVVRVRVVDRKARQSGKKYLIYDYSGELRTENLAQQLINAVISMQHYAGEWKTAPTGNIKEE